MGVFEHQLEMFEEQLKEIMKCYPVPALKNVLLILKTFASDINTSMEPTNTKVSNRNMYTKLLTKYRKQVFVGPI